MIASQGVLVASNGMTEGWDTLEAAAL